MLTVESVDDDETFEEEHLKMRSYRWYGKYGDITIMQVTISDVCQ